MRFTIRRPASAEVSPCCHRPSGGDVACSIHVGITRARTAGDAPENRLALTVFRRDMAAIRASLHVYAAGTNSTRPEALCFNRATSSPHPWRLISRLRLRFCATRLPGCSPVPRAERVIARTFKSSTLIVSNRRAKSVVVFSTQSRRRPVSRALNLLNRQFRSCTPFRAALTPAPNAAAICEVFLFHWHEARNVQQLPVRQRDRDRTPRSTPTTPPSPGLAMGQGWRLKRSAAPRASRVLVRLHVSAMVRVQRKRTQPTLGIHTCP